LATPLPGFTDALPHSPPQGGPNSLVSWRGGTLPVSWGPELPQSQASKNLTKVVINSMLIWFKSFTMKSFNLNFKIICHIISVVYFTVLPVKPANTSVDV